MMEGSIPIGFPGGPSLTCLTCSFPPPMPVEVVGVAPPTAAEPLPRVAMAADEEGTPPAPEAGALVIVAAVPTGAADIIIAVAVATGRLVGTVTLTAGALVTAAPAWAADMACLTGKGSSPLDDMVTFGAAEMAVREVAEAERMREEEEDTAFCCCCCCCCCCCGVLGDAD